MPVCAIVSAGSCFTRLSNRCGIEHFVQYPMLADFGSTLALHVMQAVYDNRTGTPMISTSRNDMGLSLSLSDDSVAASVMAAPVVIVACFGTVFVLKCLDNEIGEGVGVAFDHTVSISPPKCEGCCCSGISNDDILFLFSTSHHNRPVNRNGFSFGQY